MKINILKFSVAASLAALSLTSAAQNLDPTVVVNRAYEGKLLEVHKPAMEMAVPDSVQRFDLDFDYSVFENPYKGSYEFKPYQLLLKPVSSGVDRSRFWLDAGAGYTLYPVVNMVWTPFQNGPFKMNVYADYNAYFGQYREIFRDVDEDGVSRFVSMKNESDGKRMCWDGYRMNSKAGVDGRYDWERSAFDFNVGYYGVASKDKFKSRTFNALDLSMGLAAKPQLKSHFHYDIDLDYRFGSDYLPYSYGEQSLNEHVFAFGAVLGPVMSDASKVLFDLGFDAVAYNGALGGVAGAYTMAGQLSFTPHYVLSKNRWLVDLGARLDLLMNPDRMYFYQQKGQYIYPDVEIRFAAAKDALSIYFKADGGNRINTYSSILERNPFLGPDYMSGNGMFYLDTTVERVNVKLGFDGRIAKRFTYDLHGGYANYSGALFDQVYVQSGQWTPGFAYGSYHKLYAGVGWNLNSERVRFDGNVDYSYSMSLDENPAYFLPAMLTGDLALVYNWNRRLFAGVDCVFSTARKGVVAGDEVEIPGFADLGAYAEYAFNRKVSVWLRGGNLMNMTIQHTPLYAEKGINFTAGVRLKL
jgi:hypothetical protein